MNAGRRAAAAAVFVVAVSCGAGAAQETVPDPALLARLKALAPNTAVELGRARVLGRFNDVARRFGLDRTGPRARDFSLRMVWAPERARALFVGANHGAPHRLNDVWEFDLGAMAWILLYAPDHPRSYAGLGPDPSDVVFRDGVLATRRGGPAVIGHTWSGLTYDPEGRRLLFMNTWPIDQDALVRELGGDPAERHRGPPLWAFSPGERAWRFVATGTPAPRAPVGALLEYVPELGGAAWHMNNWQMSATWLLDTRRERWSVLADARAAKDFAAQAPGREAVGYHDAARRALVVQWRRATFHFDTAGRRWSKVFDAGADPKAAPDGHDAHTAFCADRASGHGLLVDFRDRTLWAYDPDARRWHALRPAGAPMPDGRRMLAYCDPARDVLVVIDDTRVWAYRYR